MQTKGQYLVGSTFNPSSNPHVDVIKNTTAELIDQLDVIAEGRGLGAREAALAITNYEQAAMWAVKAVTKPERDFSTADPVGDETQAHAVKSE